MFNYNKEIFTSISNKKVLKAISTLLYTAAGSDENQDISVEEQKILKTIITQDFGLTNEEHLEIFKDFGKGNLYENVLDAVKIIKQEDNQILNSTILDILSKITACDGIIDGGEKSVVMVLKEELLN